MNDENNSDFDLEKFVDLFDTAMSSTNPAVQRAFKNLLLVSTIVDSDKTKESIVTGPLRRLVEDVKHLSSRVQTLEYKVTSLPQTYYKHNTTTAIPAVKYYNTTTTAGTAVSDTFSQNDISNQLTSLINSGKYTISTGTSSTAYDDQYKPLP